MANTGYLGCYCSKWKEDKEVIPDIEYDAETMICETWEHYINNWKSVFLLYLSLEGIPFVAIILSVVIQVISSVQRFTSKEDSYQYMHEWVFLVTFF
jgi:hypothetical protein